MIFAMCVNEFLGLPKGHKNSKFSMGPVICGAISPQWWDSKRAWLGNTSIVDQATEESFVKVGGT